MLVKNLRLSHQKSIANAMKDIAQKKHNPHFFGRIRFLKISSLNGYSHSGVGTLANVDWLL
jgi:hypothetical protein